MSSGSDDGYNTNIDITTFSITLTLNVEIGDIFLFFFFFFYEKQNSTFHANYWRKFALNVKFLFLGKIIKMFKNAVC